MLVLVVEDEPLIRINAVDLVEQAGHTVLEATSADEAIKILESRSDIEIVFSDVQMPGTMDGLRLLQVIRKRWPPIKLILTSGKALREASLLPTGGIFVPKPYNLSDLTGAIAKAA